MSDPDSAASSSGQRTKGKLPANGGRDPQHELLHALQTMRSGDFTVRMTGDYLGVEGKIADIFNEIVAANERMARQLVESEQRRSIAMAAGKMGSWDWDLVNGDWMWDEGQYRIFGVEPTDFQVTSENIEALLHPADLAKLRRTVAQFERGVRSLETEFRIIRPDGDERWCVGTAAATTDASGRVVRVSGVTVDITERKLAEERQTLLAQEVDHRAKNALAVAQSIVRLTRASTLEGYIHAVEGRIGALARVQTILSLSNWQGAEIGRLLEEGIAPYASGEQIELCGPELRLQPATAQTLALAIHELITNSAKYGALSTYPGRIIIRWELRDNALQLVWEERDGPEVKPPDSRGFGTRSVISSIETQLGGRAEFDWRCEGLVCRLSVPLTKELPSRQPGRYPPHMAGGNGEPVRRSAGGAK